MKVLNFKKVASSANDAAGKQYYVPADSILSMITTDANTLVLHLRPVAGTSDDAVGDKISIVASGAAQSTGDLIAKMLYGNRFADGGACPVIDASFNGGITTISLSAV